jgi:hypothetical protein
MKSDLVRPKRDPANKLAAAGFQPAVAGILPERAAKMPALPELEDNL